MAALTPDAIALAGSQHGLLSRCQLGTALGLSEHAIDNLVKAGTLEVVSAGHYRVAGAPRTAHQELLSMVRRLRAHAADETVLALHGAPGYPLRAPFTVAVPPFRRVRRTDVVAVGIDLEEQDVEEVDGIPAMTVERAAIHLLPRARMARFRTAFHDLRRRRMLDLMRLQRRVEALGDDPGAVAMRQLLRCGGLISESPPEHDLGRIWLPGDPRPSAQIWISHNGRSYRLDWVFLASRLAPEYDGEEAHSGQGRHRDARRTLALAARQVLRLPVTAPMLRDPAGLRREILAIHEERLRAGIRPFVPEAPPAWWNGL